MYGSVVAASHFVIRLNISSPEKRTNSGCISLLPPLGCRYRHETLYLHVQRAQKCVRILLLLQTPLHLLTHFCARCTGRYKVSCRYLHPNMAHNRHQFLPICTAVRMFLSVMSSFTLGTSL